MPCCPKDFETDFVDVASRFVGSPYLWGGRESAGIDCSGLVQVALQATGISPLRDSDMQEQTLGEPVVPAEGLLNLQRGDLIFWKGHVGIMQSATTLLLHCERADPACRAGAFGRGRGADPAGCREVRSVRRILTRRLRKPRLRSGSGVHVGRASLRAGRERSKTDP